MDRFEIVFSSLLVSLAVDKGGCLTDPRVLRCFRAACNEMQRRDGGATLDLVIDAIWELAGNPPLTAEQLALINGPEPEREALR